MGADVLFLIKCIFLLIHSLQGSSKKFLYRTTIFFNGINFSERTGFFVLWRILPKNEPDAEQAFSSRIKDNGSNNANCFDCIAGSGYCVLHCSWSTVSRIHRPNPFSFLPGDDNLNHWSVKTLYLLMLAATVSLIHSPLSIHTKCHGIFCPRFSAQNLSEARSKKLTKAACREGGFSPSNQNGISTQTYKLALYSYAHAGTCFYFYNTVHNQTTCSEKIIQKNARKGVEKIEPSHRYKEFVI